MFKEAIDTLTAQMNILVIFFLFAIAGGAVRICGNPDHQKWKIVVSSLMTSIFGGMLTGIFLHNHVKDDMYLWGLVALGGYCGQLILVILSKRLESFFRRSSII